MVHEILCAESPCQFGVGAFVSAAVLSVGHQDVHAYLWHLHAELPCHLHQHSYAACSVIGPGDRFVTVGRVGVLVGRRTGVIVSQQQYPLGGGGVEPGYDVVDVKSASGMVADHCTLLYDRIGPEFA